MAENELDHQHPTAMKARLLGVARAIMERLAIAERELSAGSWRPTFESIGELEALFDHFTGDARMLSMKNAGHVLQDGQLKRED